MRKIKARFFKKNRGITEMWIDPTKDHVTVGKKTYVLDLSRVFMSTIDKGVNPTPEIFYIENDPIPLSYKPDQSDDEDLSLIILDRKVTENFIEQLATAQNPFLNVLLGLIRNPYNLFMLLLVVIIGITYFTDVFDQLFARLWPRFTLVLGAVYDPFSGDFWGQEPPGSDPGSDVIKEDKGIKPGESKGPYRVHMTILDEGLSHHRVLRLANLNAKVDLGDLGSYKIEPRYMFREKGERFDTLRRIKNRFILMYRKGDPDPLNMIQSPPEVTSNLLWNVEHSTTLIQGINNWVSRQVDTRVILIGVIIMVMIAVAYLVYAGYIKIPDLGGIV